MRAIIKNEFRHFLRIALGSLAETGYLLEFSLAQGSRITHLVPVDI